MSAKRLDEILEGVGIVLAERPTYFPLVQGSKNLRSLRTEEIPPDISSYVILFTFTANEIVLEDLQYALPED